ncbi:hypothetical protein CHUAL_003714 [Chamberlinius hualienensis]
MDYKLPIFWKIILIFCLPLVNANLSFNHPPYNILILTSPLAGTSHSIYFNGIAKELAFRGHQVTHYCRGNLENETGVRNVKIKSQTIFDEFISKTIFNTILPQKLLEKYFNIYPAAILEAINSTYNNPLLNGLLQQPKKSANKKSPFDVVLVDSLMNELYLPIIHRIGVPAIIVSPFMLLSPFAWNFNVPYQYHLNFLGISHSTSVFARTANFLMHLGITLYLKCYTFQKFLQFLPLFEPDNIRPSLSQLAQNVSFMMTSNPYSVKDTMPTTPNVANLGCVHCRAAKLLPSNLEKILNDSREHGVIYFSMGSIINSNWISMEFKNKMTKVLSQLPQTILWQGKLNSEINLTNFHFRDWFPQQDILAHPKLRLVISSGGSGTVQEVTYHGCPVLGFPLGNDHFYAMKVAKENGLGEIFNWKTFSTQQLLITINKMLTDKSYKIAAMRASVRMKDVITTPSSQAAYWTEYTIRHNGASFLKNEATNLSWCQYFLLDVLVLVVSISTGFVILCYFALKLSLKVVQVVFKLTIKSLRD